VAPDNYNTIAPLKFRDAFYKHEDIIVRADNMALT
jgi:hypothetical protein